jgi:hypothetical protein
MQRRRSPDSQAKVRSASSCLGCVHVAGPIALAVLLGCRWASVPLDPTCVGGSPTTVSTDEREVAQIPFHEPLMAVRNQLHWRTYCHGRSVVMDIGAVRIAILAEWACPDWQSTLGTVDLCPSEEADESRTYGQGNSMVCLDTSPQGTDIFFFATRMHIRNARLTIGSGVLGNFNTLGEERVIVFLSSQKMVRVDNKGRITCVRLRSNKGCAQDRPRAGGG